MEVFETFVLGNVTQHFLFIMSLEPLLSKIHVEHVPQIVQLASTEVAVGCQIQGRAFHVQMVLRTLITLVPVA
jgi:hypothetical protein